MNNDPRFFCDAMLGGLARWLRAAGYDAAYEYGIDDADLVRRAEAQGRILLSCDGPLFERIAIAAGRVRALRLPRGLSNVEALEFVARHLKLPRRESLCMACGGALAEVPRHEVMNEAPPLAYRNCDRFWRCAGCKRLFWHGTHWHKIEKRLAEVLPTVG